MAFSNELAGAGFPPANLDTTAIGPVLEFTWLPPLGEQKWLVLSGGFTYQRLMGNVATGGYPRNADLNRFKAEALARIQLPRVGSLKELVREY